MQPTLGRLTGSAGGQSAYLQGGAIATGAAKPLTGGAKLISVLPSVLAAGASFIPGIGTVVAGGLGAIGEAARQDLSGENTDFGKIGAQAALSAVPGGLGVAAKGAKALSAVNVTRAGLQAADTGVQVAKTGSQLGTALGDIAKTSTAGKATQAGNAVLASQYGAVPMPVARAIDLNKTVGQLADMGITKPVDAERVANGITGADGLLTKAVTKAAGNAGTVPTAGLPGIVNDAIQNAGLVGNDAKSVRLIVKGQLSKMAGGPNSTISGDANPSDALGVLKSLGGKIADITGKGGTYHLATSTDTAKASVLRSLSNEIEDRLYNIAGANKNLPGVLTPELRDSLVALHPTSPQWAKTVDNTIMQSKDVGSLRSAAAPFVNISKGINAAEMNSATAGGKIANSVLNGPGGIVKGVLRAGLNSGPVKQGTAAVLRGASGVGSKAAATVKGAGRLALSTAVPISSAVSGPSQNPQTASTGPNPLTAPPTDPTAATGAQDASNGTFSPSVLQAMALHDIQTTGGKNLAKIQALNSMFGAGAKTAQSLTATQQTRADAIQNAAGSITTLMQQFKQAGGANNLNELESKLPLTIGSHLQPNLSAYNATRYDTATALAQAVSGGKPQQGSIVYWENSLPKATDSAAAAQKKIDDIMQQLQQRGKIYGLDPTQLVVQ